MRPLLPTSTQWTAFPADLTNEIQHIFSKHFEKYTPQCNIRLEGRIFAEEIQFRAGYNPKGQLTQHNFEFAATYSKKDQVEDKIKNLIDHSSQLMQEHLEVESARGDDDANPMDLPRSWKQLPNDLWFQYSTVNTELEAEANRLLNPDFAEEHLVNEESINQEPLDSAVFINDPELMDEVNKKFGKKPTPTEKLH